MTRKPAMPARTLKALKASIEKWRKNENGDFQGAFLGTCPLCKLFNADENKAIDRNEQCMGCPVYARTGYAECSGTPWVEAAQEYWICGDKITKKFKAAAKREREFLESLLPKEARK